MLKESVTVAWADQTVTADSMPSQRVVQVKAGGTAGDLTYGE